MATIERLTQALRNADAAGDSIAAKRFASEIRKLQSVEPEEGGQLAPRMARAKRGAKKRAQEREEILAALPIGQREILEDMGPGEAGLIAAGRGMTKIGRAVGFADPETEDEKAAFEALSDVHPGAALAGEVIGETAPFLPLGLAAGAVKTLAPRVAASTAVGAAEAGAIMKGEGRDIEEQLTGAGIGGAIAGGVELALPHIGRIGGKIIRSRLGKEPTGDVVDAAGSPSDELLEALDKEGMEFEELLDKAREEVGRAQAEGVDDLADMSKLPKKEAKALEMASPSTTALKAQARRIYKDIDELGATVSAKAYDRLPLKMRKAVEGAGGYLPESMGKVTEVLKIFDKRAGQEFSITELDTLRKTARTAAESQDLSEARLGAIMIDEIDEFIDTLKMGDFAGDGVEGAGKQLKEARRLWRTAKKSELIEDAMYRADLAASGLENGIRQEFTRLLKNKKARKNFTDAERQQMKRVADGDAAANTAKFLGKYGFAEGRATSMLGNTLGIAGGAAVAGPIGAMVVAGVGQVSKGLAQKLTKQNAAFADQVIKSGEDGGAIVKAYFDNVQPDDRNVAELTQLLMRPEVSLEAVKKIPKKASKQSHLIQDAVYFIENMPKEEILRAMGLAGGAAASQQATGDEG